MNPAFFRPLLWCALAGSCMGFACSRQGTPALTGGSKQKVILQRNVELTMVEQRSLDYKVETVGVLEAEGQTDIPAGVPGVVDEVYFREGDEVGPGTVLAKIDQRRYEADEELARANVERSRAYLGLARDQLDRAERASTSEEDRAKARFSLRGSEAEYRSMLAAWDRARHFLDKSRVRAPYAGRINKRLVTKGTYVEEKNPIATIADLSRIRLAGYVPETAAPTVRELFRTQEKRLEVHRLALPLAGLGGPPWASAAGALLVHKDVVPSGFDPEFQLQVMPGHKFLARLFYLSTVADPTTHMFEAKAEVLGYMAETPPGLIHYLRTMPRPRVRLIQAGLHVGSPWLGLAGALLDRQRAERSPMLFWPGLTAKIFFNLKSNPKALVVPEEAVRASERGFIAFVPEKKIKDDGTSEWIARARTLELGFRTEGWVEVRQGLGVQDWIVRRGAEALEDGTPIRFNVGPK